VIAKLINPLAIYLATVLIYLPLLDFGINPSGVLYAAVSGICAEQLNKAEELYYNGEFDSALMLTNQCLQDSSLISENKMKAYIIRARIYLSKNESDSARLNINKILDLNPDYQPTLEQEKPQYVHLVMEIKIERAYAEQKSGRKGVGKWVWIGAGTVATAAIITLIASGSGAAKDHTKNSLAEPPPFPE